MAQIAEHNHAKKPHLVVYLLPNLFTATCLFCGFYAMTLTTQGRFTEAAWALFAGLIADTLDGRAARLTGTQSDFGKQFDSLADMVTSGVAPGWMAYYWGLMHMGKVGLSLTFLYVAATAMRLARFNLLNAGASSYFKGLPCPAAAASIATILLCVGQGWLYWSTSMMAFIVCLLACLMVSDIPYYSFKTFEWRGRYSWFIAIAVVVLLALLFIDPPMVLLLVLTGYLFSGLLKLVPKMPGSVNRILKGLKVWWQKNSFR